MGRTARENSRNIRLPGYNLHSRRGLRYTIIMDSRHTIDKIECLAARFRRELTPHDFIMKGRPATPAEKDLLWNSVIDRAARALQTRGEIELICKESGLDFAGVDKRLHLGLQ